MGFFKNSDDWGRSLLERYLSVVNGEFCSNYTYGMIGGPLERSLPVVNGEFFQKLGRLGVP